MKRYLLTLVACAGICALQATEGGVWIWRDGANITGCWTLDPQAPTSLRSVAQLGTYDVWNSSWYLPGKYGTISFDAVTTNDVTVGVTTYNPWAAIPAGMNMYNVLTHEVNMYEIVLGGWGNTQCAIRCGTQTQPMKHTFRGLPSSVNSAPVSYKVIFYRGPGGKDVIAAFARNPDTQQWERLIVYRKLTFNEGPRWISFSSWDVNVFYSNIQISEATELPA